MPDTSSLTDFLRYQLSSLNVKNKHHDFEEMCFQFSRLAISPNFLPATGPVSSGGDQGRDSETFAAAIQSIPLVGSEWAFADGRKAVIACSLEKKYKQKIELDVKKICLSNRPHSIYFFSNQDIPVATRHKLQEQVRATYGVHLEVFDLLAIADQLVRPELFWIAQSFLNIPSEMYPRSDDTRSEKYFNLRKKWIEDKRLPQTFSDFAEIKYCIRKATFNNQKKIDVFEWIGALRKFSVGTPDMIIRRCNYEICVAALRGLGTLDNHFSLVESYFSDISSLDANQIEDAVVLLSYCSSAVLQKTFECGTSVLYEWTQQLVTRIEYLLKQAISTNSKCDLLAHRAYAATLMFYKGVQPGIDWADSFKWWSRLLSEVKHAPLFPLERFSNLITALAPMIGDEPGYDKLTDSLNDALSARSQGYLAAEKCRDRALAFMDQSRPIRAINEFHNSKIKWFSKETLRGSILSMLMLSRLYSELHMVWAAKYYTLAAAYLVHQDNDDASMKHFPSAVIQLFQVCYQGGEWLFCINLLPIVCASHFQYRTDPENFEKYEDFQAVIVHSRIIYDVNQKIGNDNLAEEIRDVLRKWPLPANLDELVLREDEESSSWVERLDVDQLWIELNDALDMPPFCDVGPERKFSWRGLGITWEVICDNVVEVVACVESFIACLQVVIVDLAEVDLNLIPTTVNIRVDALDYLDFDLKEVGGNAGSSWKLNIPPNQSTDDLAHWALAFATMILSECSLLSEKQFQEIFEQSVRRGLSAKTFVVRPYYDLLKEFRTGDADRLSQQPSAPNVPAGLCQHEASALAWRSGPGPGYTKATSLELIANRYKKAIIPVRLSVRSLNEIAEFHDFVNELRRLGYLDWHILLLIANVAINRRFPVGPNYQPSTVDRRALLAAFEHLESEGDALLTMADLSEIPVEMHLNTQLASVCATLGLHFKSRTPDFAALKKVLVERYGYFTDDIPHEQLFVKAASVAGEL